MTTTAEKIKVMQAFEDGAQIQAQPSSAITKARPWLDIDEPDWNWTSYNYRVKSPDTEPLDLLFAVQKKTSAVIQAFALDEPKDPLPDAYKLVRMREVTPQDKRDRLDAERYRKAKRLPTAIVESLARSAPDDWDNIVDNC